MLADINLQRLVDFMFGMCLASTNTSHPSKDHHKFYKFHILLILFLVSTQGNAAFTPVHAVLIFKTLDLSGWFPPPPPRNLGIVQPNEIFHFFYLMRLTTRAENVETIPVMSQMILNSRRQFIYDQKDSNSASTLWSTGSHKEPCLTEINACIQSLCINNRPDLAMP